MKHLAPALLSLFLLHEACIQNKRSNPPEDVVQQWQSYIDKNQFDLARQLSMGEALHYIDYLDAITYDTLGSEQTMLFDLKCVTQGDSAVCSFLTEDEIGEKYPDTLILHRVNGRWFVHTVEGFEETPLDAFDASDGELVFPPSDSVDQEFQ